MYYGVIKYIRTVLFSEGLGKEFIFCLANYNLYYIYR